MLLLHVKVPEVLLQLKFVSVAACFFLLPLGSIAYAQDQSAANMLDRFSQGRAVLNAAAEAMGGAQALRGMNAVSFTARGDTYNDVQGFHAANIGRPERDGRLIVTNNFDFANARFSQRTQQELAGGFALDSTTVFRDGTLYSLRNNGEEYLQTPNSPPPTAAGGLVAIVARWSPPLLVQRALQNLRSVTWVGEAMVGGAPTDAIEFSFDEISRFRLYIARADHQVVRMEAVLPDAVAADDVSVVEFSGAQNVGGVVFPTHLIGIRRGVRTFDMAIENVAVNPTLEEALFQPPANYRLVADDTVTTTRINDRIYEVSGLGGGVYRSQFAVMDDFVVVFEAPLGIAVTRQVIAEIRRIAGEKPIRYVVISHFHSDHAGGVGAYADLGATIVSAAENSDVMRRYAAARSQSFGLPGFRTDLQINFQPVGPEGYEIVDAGGHRLQVINFQTPHVERLLTLYDPETRTIMNGDLFSRLVRWNQTFDVFARWLRRNNPRVDTVLGTHHEPLTREQLLSAARARRR